MINRHSQTLLVEVEKLAIWLIFDAFEAIAAARRLATSFLLKQAWGVVADVLDHLDLLLPIMFPIVDIIDALLLLQSLQKLFVFDCDSLSIYIACRPVK